MSAENEQLLGRVAVASKAITAEQLDQALKQQASDPGKSLGEVLIALGMISELVVLP